MFDFELAKNALNLQQKKVRLTLETSFSSKTSEVVQWKFSSPKLLTVLRTAFISACNKHR